MNQYEKLSNERKELQEKGLAPDWFTTGGYQIFKSKYLYGDNPKEHYMRIAKTLAKHTKDEDLWTDKFFNLLWKGWLSPSTPVLSNTGTNRGLSISCAGNYVDDSVQGFYESLTETAILSKNGFGTSSYLSDVRPRGSKISTGGKSLGVLPVLKMHIQTSIDISQGGVRRGAWAGYLHICHGDFWEVYHYLENNPDDCNIGWIITDEFIQRILNNDHDAMDRYKSVLELKAVLGKGYFLFVDKVNRLKTQTYKDNNLDIKASNLCNEIMLHSSIDYTFTCCLSSMNLSKYDEWKDTDAIFDATVFLDCVVSDFLANAKDIKHLEKAVRFTEKGRAIGLGVMGLFTYFQQKMIDPESIEAHVLNTKIFQHIDLETTRATKWLAKEFGEPEWCKGHGIRNTLRIAIAPTKSTGAIMGGVSEGISPLISNVFTSSTSAGDINRINPVLLDIMKKRGVYSEETLSSIQDNKGSVKHVVWLNEHEKNVFKTAYELNQFKLLKMASARQRYIDQGQSLNLFIIKRDADEYLYSTGNFNSNLHLYATLDPYIKGLYYIYSDSPSRAESTVKILSQKNGECESCQ